MRTCLGILCGIIFLIASSFFILVLNLDRTVYNANFDKQAVNASGIYQSLPATIVAMVSNGQITASSDQELSPETKEIIIETVRETLTPNVLKKHTESIIDQILSDKTTVTEDLSDINNSVNAKMSSAFSEMMGIAITANSDNTFVPKSITFDKSQNQLGRSVIYYKKALWISLAATLLFLILLFFASADNYKSRFRWVGGFLIALGILTSINFALFRLISLKWIVNAVNSSFESGLSNGLTDQIIKLTDIFKIQFSVNYLIEAIAIIVLVIIIFVVAAVIPAKQAIQPPATAVKVPDNKSKDSSNTPKNS
jgi:hypothetical protein